MKFLWIFDIDALWTLIPLVSFLWAAGGSGPKLFRRAGVPGIVCLSAFSLGVAWWLVLLTAASMLALMSLPYGSGIKAKLGFLYWPWLYLVSAGYAASTLPLVFFHHHWLGYFVGIAASSLSFGTLTICSQKLSWPTWKWVEMTLGACLGLAAAMVLN